MDSIDSNRWARLLDAWRDAEHDGPQFIELQRAQGAASQARADLDRHRSRGPLGRADQFHSREEIDAAFNRDIAELERRVAAAEREVKRIDAKIRSCAARRAVLHHIVEACRQWAQAQGITLPGDDAVKLPAGFGPTTHVHSPPPREPLPSGLAPQQHGGSGFSRMFNWGRP
jgi:hypothetical protein